MSDYPPPNVPLAPIFNPTQFLNTSLYLTASKADARYLKLSGGTETGSVLFKAGFVSEAQITSTAPASASAPSFSPTPNAGMYAGAAAQLNWSTASVSRMTLTSGNLVTTIPIRTNSGTITSPAHSFSNSSSTGMSWTGSLLNFSVVGTQSMTLSNTVGISTPFGLKIGTTGSQVNRYTIGATAITPPGVPNVQTVSITHGLGLTPTNFQATIVASAGGTDVLCATVTALTSTTATVKIVRVDGVGWSATYDVYWTASA